MPNMESTNFDALYVLEKGEPGTRKSTQALSFPTPQEWFSWDRKMNSIILPMRKWGIDPKLITFNDYDDWDKPRRRLEQLQTSCEARTLIFDSITSMADMTLRQVIKMKYGKTRSSGAQAGKLIAGIPVSEIEDYNAESAALNELIALTKDIHQFHKVNIILIAHVIQAEYRSTTNNTTHISRQIVTAGKKVAAKIPAYCGEIYHFNIKKGFVEGSGGDYSLLTSHVGDDFARTGLDLPSEIVFGDKPLYDTWIKPAIVKMQQSTTPTTKF